jgi:hypothetical protein
MDAKSINKLLFTCKHLFRRCCRIIWPSFVLDEAFVRLRLRKRWLWESCFLVTDIKGSWLPSRVRVRRCCLQEDVENRLDVFGDIIRLILPHTDMADVYSLVFASKWMFDGLTSLLWPRHYQSIPLLGPYPVLGHSYLFRNLQMWKREKIWYLRDLFYTFDGMSSPPRRWWDYKRKPYLACFKCGRLIFSKFEGDEWICPKCARRREDREIAGSLARMKKRKGHGFECDAAGCKRMWNAYFSQFEGDE